MIRWLFIILFIYLVYRLIQGPKRRKNPPFRFHFRNFGNGDGQNSPSSSRPKLDDIEEAEFEDITEKSEKEKKEESK